MNRNLTATSEFTDGAASGHFRAYQRALRQAEALAWEAALPSARETPAHTADSHKPLHLILSLMILAALMAMAFGDSLPFDLTGWN